MSVVELVRLGEEAGLRREAVDQALTELRRGVPLEPEESGALTRTLGARPGGRQPRRPGADRDACGARSIASCASS